MHDKALVKTERAISLWIENLNHKGVLVDGHTICKKVLTPYEHFSKIEPSGGTSADSCLNTLMLNALNYIHYTY